LRTWFEKKLFGESDNPEHREVPRRERPAIRVGIPRVLNLWNTHQFWVGFLRDLGISPQNIVFSSETSEEQGRTYGKGRGTVDCCYPVKCMSGHYGELLWGQKKKINLLLSPMIHCMPSFLRGHVVDTMTCTRVMASPESIKAGFLKERDVFAECGVTYASPFVTLSKPELVAEQLYESLGQALDLSLAETRRAVEAGYRALADMDARLRAQSRKILEWCARENRPCILVLARPYHMDPGIGHEIEAELQASGYPVLWGQYFPLDEDILEWLFGQEVRAGRIDHPLDINDVWVSSYSSNTNEILWCAKAAARCPWITCVLRLSSYECGMDQPTYTPTQKIVEATGTLFFKFGDLDSTKPAGAIRIRTETILHYLGQYSQAIIERKLNYLPAPHPFAGPPAPSPIQTTSEEIVK